MSGRKVGRPPQRTNKIIMYEKWDNFAAQVEPEQLPLTVLTYEQAREEPITRIDFITVEDQTYRRSRESAEITGIVIRAS